MLIDPGYGNLRRFDSKVVEYDDAKDECTIFATDAGENREKTAWISAQEGSYIAARAMR